jgi:hypothetical protein
LANRRASPRLTLRVAPHAATAYPTTMSSNAPQTLSAEALELQKVASRNEDLRALANGQKTAKQLALENMPFRLSGRRIDYFASQSELW